jgi:hypothetical protein
MADLDDGISLSDEDAVMSQPVSGTRNYAVGDVINADVADILGDPSLVGKTMTVEDAQSLKTISTNLGIDDVSVSLPEDFVQVEAPEDDLVFADEEQAVSQSLIVRL